MTGLHFEVEQSDFLVYMNNNNQSVAIKCSKYKTTKNLFIPSDDVIVGDVMTSVRDRSITEKIKSSSFD